MKEEVHVRAEQLIAQERVEGISAAEQQWLEEHLRECPACGEFARTTTQAIRSLQAVSVAMPRGLASRTQMRVRLRAQQLQGYEPRWRLVWLACGVSWAFGAATAPYIWRALEWAGHRMGVPNVIWEMGFGLWWALPAAVTGILLLMTNAGRSTEADWKRQ
jgi:predicted anti-sigma-YlaC factor YlaD